MHLVEEALRAKQMEFILQRDALVAMRTPGYTEGLLKNILDLPMTPALRREFEYQSVNIKY
ncbi:MAG TPA: hypothetical protein VJ385_21070, partial [Fibrobacteria bacterium]|nr:hypothetical protein [Fibrobacteria bacterium]